MRRAGVFLFIALVLSGCGATPPAAPASALKSYSDLRRTDGFFNNALLSM
jgi:hypothetical protein